MEENMGWNWLIKNTIIFLNGLSKDYLKTIGIKDRISVITWARKVVGNHQHLDTLQSKVDIMEQEVKMFIELFTSFLKGFYLYFGKKMEKLYLMWNIIPNYSGAGYITRSLKTCNNLCLEKQ